MLHSVRNNPFTGIFQKYYETTMLHTQSKDIAAYIKDFLTIDDQEIFHAMTHELANTLTLYSSKLKNEKIQVITLLIDAPADEHFIPSIILASAYESYAIKQTYSIPAHQLLPETDNLYTHLELGKNIFYQFGGCDIDILSDILFDIISVPDIVKSNVFTSIQTLVIIKILELLYNACALLMKSNSFLQLPKNHPFSFFAHCDNHEYITITTYD
ncbi:MAG: hypothetical protein N3F66_13385 [Spirochaetes bacterium]|nr:hypothetical protein [Spirochaetota bacterium]